MSSKRCFGEGASHLIIAGVILLMCLPSAAQQADPAALKELLQMLVSERMMPRVQIAGRFEAYATRDSPALQPRTSSDFSGILDVATRALKYSFPGYKQPVEGQADPFQINDLEVTFDGDKWLLVRTPLKRDGMPAGVNAIGEVSSTRPDMFLKTLDQLCFPLFAPLADLQVKGEMVPLSHILDGRGKFGEKIGLQQTGPLVVLTVRIGCFIDTFSFDSTKGFALVRRETNFSGCDLPGASPNNQLRNDLVIKELVRSGQIWLPKRAEFAQYRGDKIQVWRSYALSECKVLDGDYPIAAVAPANAIIVDHRFGINFKTSESVPVREKPQLKK
jgi:hypothetical protein